MRLFLAFELPDELRGRIAERVEPLRSALPPASWVPAARMHLTLAFLGEVEEPRVAALDRALRPVFAAAPRLCLRLAGPGTFPPARPARVAWIGVEARAQGMRAEGVVHTTPEAHAVLGAEGMRAEGVVHTTPEARAVLGAEGMRAEGVVHTAPEASVLAAIERRVREVLATVLQHPLEDRPYHAHVTVARLRRPWGREAVARFRSACDDLVAEWEAARAVLMESELGRGGARYSVRREYALDCAAS